MHASRRLSDPTSRKFWALPGVSSAGAEAGAFVPVGPDPATVTALAWVITTRSRSSRRWLAYQTPSAATTHTTAIMLLPPMSRRWGQVRRRRRWRRRGASRSGGEAGCGSESAMTCNRTEPRGVRSVGGGRGYRLHDAGPEPCRVGADPRQLAPAHGVQDHRRRTARGHPELAGAQADQAHRAAACTACARRSPAPPRTTCAPSAGPARSRRYCAAPPPPSSGRSR